MLKRKMEPNCDTILSGADRSEGPYPVVCKTPSASSFSVTGFSPGRLEDMYHTTILLLQDGSQRGLVFPIPYGWCTS